MEAIKYAEEHCDAAKVGGKLGLVLAGNKFDAEDKAALETAVESSAVFLYMFKHSKNRKRCTHSPKMGRDALSVCA